MFCTKCGQQIPDDAAFCTNCGNKANPSTAQNEMAAAAATQTMTIPLATTTQKSKWAAFFLCLFLGGIGAHRFYVGKIGTGILYIFTLGGFLGIGALIDLIRILIGNFKDKQGQVLV
jgi:TM2 domain-containing membrane protein YozV